jgi:alkylated DNA repair protein alkB family protein 6
METSIKIPACLEDVRIENLPADAFYVADFITPDEEQVILEKVYHFIA